MEQVADKLTCQEKGTFHLILAKDFLLRPSQCHSLSLLCDHKSEKASQKDLVLVEI